MGQKLILPINKAKLTASWKTGAYRERFGLIHYGIDLVSTEYNCTLYASGDGIVIAQGTDNVVGKVVIIRYTAASNRITGKVEDIILRYFHMDRIDVKTGQAVTKDTVLGLYGTTGLLSTGAHLHLEADTDTAWPRYSPTVWNSNFLQGRIYNANDKTMSNPLEWLHCKTSKPDKQSWATTNDAYIRTEDKDILKVN